MGRLSLIFASMFQKMIWGFLLFHFTSALAQQNTVPPAGCTALIRLRIVDADTRETLPNASIRIVGVGKDQTILAKNGEALLQGFCVGNYDLFATHAGCSPQSIHFHLKDSASLTIAMSHAAQQLQNITVQSNASKNTGLTTEIKGQALAATKGLSLGESLQQVPGVAVLQTGSNIYKPIINGLHSNRILMLNNGIRQEGQQWGSEHAPEIDPFIANRLVVIKGAQTLQYGGDAIGGVILVEPKLLSRIAGIHGEVNLAAFSNNRMGVANAMIEGMAGKNKGLGWRIQGSVRRGGSGRTPLYWLHNSALSEYNFSATAGWEKQRSQHQLFYSNFNTRLGIFSGAHIGNVTDLLNAISNALPPDYIRDRPFTYAIERPYQEVQHQLIKWKSQWMLADSARVVMQVSGQWNRREEYDIRQFASSSMAPQLSLNLYTLAADYSYEKYWRKRHKMIIGGNTSLQQNNYDARYFIPNYSAFSQGIYLIQKLQWGRWEPEFGIRGDVRSLYNMSGRPGMVIPSRNFGSVTGNASLGRQLSQSIRLLLQFSSAWRPPQVNELFADGLHHGAARLERGDASLRPERANTVQASVHHQKGKLRAEISGYSKWIDGFIFLQPSYPPQLTIRGAFPSFIYNQTNAWLYGIDAQISYKIDAHLSAELQGSVLRARDVTQNNWIVQMPADRATASVMYQFAEGKWFSDTYLKLNAQAVARQTRIPAVGNIPVKQADGSTAMESDYLPPPAGYVLAGAEAGTAIRVGAQRWNLILAATNLLNHRYRDYLNAFRYYADELGTNVSVRLQIPISINAR